MGYDKYFTDIIDSKILDVHTAYLAKVLSVSGDTAKIQPLGMTKEVGKEAIAQSPLSNIPIATHKFKEVSASVVTGVTLSTKKTDGYVSSASLNVTKETINFLQEENVKKGDIVVCICCERNITEAKKGKNTELPVGHHSMSDSIIIAVL